MQIERLMTPAYACSDSLRVTSIARLHDRILICEINQFPIERILIEFDQNRDALDFSAAIEDDTAILVIDNESLIPETTGLVRLAVMHDDGIAAFGFKGHNNSLYDWLRGHGFPHRRCRISHAETDADEYEPD